MIITEKIISLILSRQENDQADFKERYYSEYKKYDLIKDIVSLANNTIPEDKYIIFGVEDQTFNILGIELPLPDISTINDLLRTYVEPYVNVELGSFDYVGRTIGYIRIPHQGLDRPYIIAKEYNKNNNVSLRKGEIYIRKGATNFIANRSDLDSIYANRGTVKINFYELEATIDNVRIMGVSQVIGQLRCVIQNNTPKTIVFDCVKISLKNNGHLLEHRGLFLDDKKYVFEKAPKMLTECPITLAPGDCIQKTIYFDISKSAAINLYESKTQKASTQIRIIDVLKTTYQSESADIDLKFSNALLSVCGEI